MKALARLLAPLLLALSGSLALAQPTGNNGGSNTGGNGTVQSVTAGAGLSGGTITTTGTIALPTGPLLSGVTVDATQITQTSSGDTFPFYLLPPTAVTYPGGSLSISSSNCGGIVTVNSASPSTFTFPPVKSPFPASCWVIVKNTGTGLVSTATSGSTTFNGAGTSIYLSTYMSALFQADSTASPGNWDVGIGGGFLPTSVGVPVYQTAVGAPGFIPTSTSPAAAGRVLPYSAAPAYAWWLARPVQCPSITTAT